MKDYEEKVVNIMDSAKDNIKTQLNKAYKSGYDQGYEDVKSELGQKAIDIVYKESDKSYQQGLGDAWECVKKILKMDVDTKNELFGHSFLDYIAREYCASDVLQIIKKYEEEQKQNTEIQVGDEVVTKYGTKGVVITNVASEEGMISVWLPTYTHVQLYPVKDLSKTGRHFDQIDKVFAEMRREEG